MKVFLNKFCAFALILSLGVSCSKNEKIGVIKNNIRINFQQDPTTLDPRKGADYTSVTVLFLLFEGLVRMTPNSVSAPGIAESIEVSDNNMKYTFHLRDAKWSNGVPITAYDFSQTWLDMLDPLFPSPNAHLLFAIKNAEKAKKGLVNAREIGIHVVNHKTLEVYLEKPTPYFEELITYSAFFPVCQHHIQENLDWAEGSNEAFVCNGPYRVAKRQLGNELILEKNPYYWDADAVHLEEINISMIDNEMTALNMFLNNQLDMIGLPFTGIPTDSIPGLLEKGLIKTTEIPATTIYCFNMDSFPFNNKNLRKAFAYSINRQEIVDNITQTGEIPGMNLLPDNLIKNQPTPYFKDGDVETAREHLKRGLAELNITMDELPQLTLLHASTGIYPKVAQAVQEQWRQSLGINVELRGYEYKVFLDKLGKKDFCISQCIWVADYFDPMTILDRFRLKENVKNYPGYDNKEYRDLLVNSDYKSCREERFAELNKALSIINEEVPLTAIYHWQSPYLVKPYLEDFITLPSGFFHLPEIKLNHDKLPKNRPSQVVVK